MDLQNVTIWWRRMCGRAGWPIQNGMEGKGLKRKGDGFANCNNMVAEDVRQSGLADSKLKHIKIL